MNDHNLSIPDSLREVAEKNLASQSNSMFTEDYFQYYGCRFETELIDHEYFITSEREYPNDRKFTIHQVVNDGEAIKTVGGGDSGYILDNGFKAHATLDDAIEKLEEISRCKQH